jgi:hypothetical protein
MDNLPIRLLENLQILIEQGATTGMLSRAIAEAIEKLREPTSRQESPRHPQSST